MKNLSIPFAMVLLVILYMCFFTPQQVENPKYSGGMVPMKGTLDTATKKSVDEEYVLAKFHTNFYSDHRDISVLVLKTEFSQMMQGKHDAKDTSSVIHVYKALVATKPGIIAPMTNITMDFDYANSNEYPKN